MSDTKPTLADKQTQLAELLKWFESDDFELEKAASQIERAHKIAGDIETELSEIENKISVLAARFDQEEA